jgi:hypothetical protein
LWTESPRPVFLPGPVLENHGFLYTKAGWRLARAFDVGPNIKRDAHILRMDDTHHRASLACVKKCNTKPCAAGNTATTVKPACST